MTLAEAAAFAEATAQPSASREPASDVAPSAAAASRRASVLTPREHEVAALIANGLTNGQIAAELVAPSGLWTPTPSTFAPSSTSARALRSPSGWRCSVRPTDAAPGAGRRSVPGLGHPPDARAQSRQ